MRSMLPVVIFSNLLSVVTISYIMVDNAGVD